MLVHGWSQSQLCWSRQTAGPLADDFRLVTFDLRGHGMSEKPLDAEPYVDARLWADDLNAVIEQLELDRPVLVGWSYGGYVVTDYLAAYGETAIAGVDLVGAAVLRTPTFEHIGPGLLENAGDACGPDLPHEHRRHAPLPARLHRAAAERRRLEHGALLEHGRPGRDPSGAVRARDRRRRSCSRACPSRCW